MNLLIVRFAKSVPSLFFIFFPGIHTLDQHRIQFIHILLIDHKFPVSLFRNLQRVFLAPP